MPRKIEISHRTIIFTFVLIGLVWFFLRIADIVLVLSMSLLVTVVLNPLVTKLSKFKIPRGLSILLVYLVVLGVGIFSIASLVPVLVEQTSSFASGLPQYFEGLNLNTFLGDQLYQQVLSQLGSLPRQIVGFFISVLSNFVTVLTILVFAFYMLLSRNKLNSHLGFFFGEEKRVEVVRLIDELELKLGGWARGQFLLMLTVGSFSYLGLTLLGVPFALPLAILAGLLEVVPYVGPIVAAIPAVIVAFGISPVVGFAATALVFLIQQLENYVLVPKIMERSVGVSPLIILLALTIGFRIAGIAGVLISVPVVITLKVLAGQRLLKISKI